MRRSRAAKLGWKRRLEREERVEQVDSEIVKAGHLESAEKRIAELERINEQNADLIEFLRKASVNHPNPEVMKKFRRDGTLAFQWSTLRHTDTAEEYYERLKAAEKQGNYALEQEAARIAEESHSELREVYTLFHSP